jgi:hypothetical protein
MNARNVVVWGVLAALLVIVFFEARMVARRVQVRDLSSYWAAAHLAEDNPYSAEKVQYVKQKAGITNSPNLIMRNPPWALAILFPFRWLDYFSLFALWTMVNILIVSICAATVWNLYGGKNPVWALLISLFFGPTLLLLRHGQMTGLVLLGYVAFLGCIEKKRDWVAGASLFFVSLKPHLALLFFIFLFLWSVRTGRYAVIATWILSVVLASLLVISINPLIFDQYRSLIHDTPLWSNVYPNLGGILALISGRQWASLLPLLAGCAWSLYYWITMRGVWSWRNHLPIVLLMSLVTSYYSYGYDEVIILPALLQVALDGDKKTFILPFLVVNFLILVCAAEWRNAYDFGFMFNSWTATAWISIYLISRYKKESSEKGLPAGR